MSSTLDMLTQGAARPQWPRLHSRPHCASCPLAQAEWVSCRSLHWSASHSAERGVRWLSHFAPGRFSLLHTHHIYTQRPYPSLIDCWRRLLAALQRASNVALLFHRCPAAGSKIRVAQSPVGSTVTLAAFILSSSSVTLDIFVRTAAGEA